MATYLWIAIGSGIGGVARFGMSGWMAHRFGETFPWGTIAVNVTGCFIIGFFATLPGPDGRWLADATQRQFFMTGVLGGFTTFSSLSIQSLNLARDGQWLLAAVNAVGSLIACLIAVWLGHMAAQTLTSLKGP
jgi:fluoride exporter